MTKQREYFPCRMQIQQLQSTALTFPPDSGLPPAIIVMHHGNMGHASGRKVLFAEQYCNFRIFEMQTTTMLLVSL